LADSRRWLSNELEMMANEAIEHFRHGRSGEPLVLYSDFFQAFVPVFTDLIDNKLPKLAETNTEVDQELVASIVSDQQARTAFRYLAAPPISDDDLRTLGQTRLSARALRTNPQGAERVREVVLNFLDPHRFPWIGMDRQPSSREREIAVIASAVLVASQKVGTRRRSNAKLEQEPRVKEVLSEIGFAEVPSRDIPLLEYGPEPRANFAANALCGPCRRL
jgi:hypothetical protein